MQTVSICRLRRPNLQIETFTLPICRLRRPVCRLSNFPYQSADCDDITRSQSAYRSQSTDCDVSICRLRYGTNLSLQIETHMAHKSEDCLNLQTETAFSICRLSVRCLAICRLSVCCFPIYRIHYLAWLWIGYYLNYCACNVWQYLAWPWIGYYLNYWGLVSALLPALSAEVKERSKVISCELPNYLAQSPMLSRTISHIIS